MARKQLVNEIQILDSKLDIQRTQLTAMGQSRMAGLRSISPLWLIAGGAVAGVLVQRAVKVSSVSGAGSLALASLRLWPALSNGMKAGAAFRDASE
ncbi:MAG: hypothetical protein ACK4VV_16220 [Pseudomonas sp.]